MVVDVKRDVNGIAQIPPPPATTHPYAMGGGCSWIIILRCLMIAGSAALIHKKSKTPQREFQRE